MNKSIFINVIMLLACFTLSTLDANAEIVVHESQKVLEAPMSQAYQWYQNGEVIEGEKNRQLEVKETGLYTVTYTSMTGQAEKQSAFIQVKGEKIVKIYIIGDSTVADYTRESNYMSNRYPLAGWGQVFQETMHSGRLDKLSPFLAADSVEIIDEALGGRSTRTFWQEGHWKPIYEALQPGDYVMIQFGHNDASEDHPDRYVDIPGYKDYLRQYVNQTREKGGIPILITPVNRNYPWSGGKLSNVHGDYPQAVHEVSQELHVPLIDLTQRSIDYFTEVGKSYATDSIFMSLPAGKYEAYPDGQDDGTHFQVQGAKQVAELVYEGLENLVEVKVTSAADSTAGTIEGNGWYERDLDSVAILKATPNRGWTFDQWTGDTTTTSNALKLPLNENKVIEGHFKATDKQQYELNYDGGTGSINVYPYGGLYEEGTEVSLSATAPRYKKLYAWSGDYQKLVTEGDMEATFTINSDMQVNPVFIEDDAFVFQADQAQIANDELATSGAFFTGNGYVHVASGQQTSITWHISLEGEDRAGVGFRYNHNGPTDVLGDVLINGEKEIVEMDFEPSTEGAAWLDTRSSFVNFSSGFNKVELVFDNPASDVHIDFLKIRSDVNVSNGVIAAKEEAKYEGMSFQVNPNPLKEKATLSFTINQERSLRIALCDLAGKCIDIVKEQNYPAGQHTVALNKSGFSKGTYVCRLINNEHIMVKKIVIQ